MRHSCRLAKAALAALMVIVLVVMIVAVIAMIVPMVLTIVGDIGIGVPVVPDEVDRLTAGVVLSAVIAPITFIAWAHVQIDRWRQHTMSAYGHNGRAIDETGCRRVADIHATVKARVAQADRGLHLSERCAADYQRCNAHSEK